MTPEDVRKALIDHCKQIAFQWSVAEINDPQVGSLRGRIEGAIFDVLTTLDGCYQTLPAFTLTADWTVGDEDGPFIEAGTEVAAPLHEFWHQ